jgi:transposase
MSQGRRQFTDEFKREAVALLVSSGRPLTQIAGELGYRAVDAAQLARAGRRAECRASVAPQRAGDGPAFCPGPGGRDLPASPRERSAADGARHSKKTLFLIFRMISSENA